MRITREWAMPSCDTMSIPAVMAFVERNLLGLTPTVDPFARNCSWATYTNDLDPDTAAQDHMDAEAWLVQLHENGIVARGAIFDPPYSPRQISEVYTRVGLEAGMAETQNAALYRRVRDALVDLLEPGAIVVSMGWNSAGMGRKRGFVLVEALMVCHGAAHNDTILVAERMEHGRLFGTNVLDSPAARREDAP